MGTTIPVPDRGVVRSYSRLMVNSERLAGHAHIARKFRSPLPSGACNEVGRPSIGVYRSPFTRR